MSVRKVILPKLGLTMDEGAIARWYHAEGDRVAEGKPLLEVETDKVTMDLEAPTSGYLRRIVVGPGETVPVTTVIALIADTLEEPIDAAGPAPEAAAPAPALEADDGPAAATPLAPAPQGDRVAASPAARKRAAELGVDLAQVSGSGPGGRIQIEDVERAAADRAG